MTKLIWTISILLLGLVPVARGQQQSSGGLSNMDKAAIIEAVLNLELPSGIYFSGGRRALSLENIEFLELSRLSDHGFRYFSADYIRTLKQDRVIEYLRFNQILLRDGDAVVTLSRVAEGRACFAEAFFHEQRYTYRARQTVVGWIAELTQGPPPLISFPSPSFRPLSVPRKAFSQR